jgi:hypothetical protein
MGRWGVGHQAATAVDFFVAGLDVLDPFTTFVSIVPRRGSRISRLAQLDRRSRLLRGRIRAALFFTESAAPLGRRARASSD